MFFLLSLMCFYKWVLDEMISSNGFEGLFWYMDGMALGFFVDWLF